MLRMARGCGEHRYRAYATRANLHNADTQPEEFVDRLSAEHSTLIDHTPYKLPVTLSSVSAESPKTRTIHAPWSRGESWEEQARMTILQIGPSTQGGE
jgi:hypothetical protein